MNVSIRLNLMNIIVICKNVQTKKTRITNQID
jgi:hypothetical protein